METTFARWLRENGIAPHVFARECGVHFRAVYRLAGIKRRNDPAKSIHVRQATLAAISAITAIPERTLIADAWEAWESPREPRKYTRKERA